MSTATAKKSTTVQAKQVDLEMTTLAVKAAAVGMAIGTGEPIENKRAGKYRDRAALLAENPGVSMRVNAFEKRGTADTLKYSIQKNEGVWKRDDVTFSAVVARPTADEVATNQSLENKPFGVYVVATKK